MLIDQPRNGKSRFKSAGKEAIAAWAILALVIVAFQASHSCIRTKSGDDSGIDLRAQKSPSQLRRLAEIAEENGLKDRKRAFVCITGQLARLELDNKVENLIRHWHENFKVDIDVALVLAQTNHSSVRRGGSIEQKYFNTAEVADQLTKLPGVTVLNRDDFVGADNPVVNPFYFMQRSVDNKQSNTKVLHRTQNHVRQFESLAKCYSHMIQSPLASKEYDIVHRVRDDSGYFLPVPFDSIYNMTRKKPKTMVSSSCQQHLGINDRGSFVSPLAAFDYFVHPIMYMYTQPLPRDVKSTEMFLLNAYSKTSHLVETHQFRMFRMFTSSREFYQETDRPILLPGTNFDSEGGEVDRCIINLQSDGPRRDTPRCHRFADGNKVCVEIA